MKIETIEELNEYIESSIVKFRKQVDVSFKIKELTQQIDNEDSQKIINWEIEALQFVLSEGETKPNILNTDKEGNNILEYPSHNNFSTEAYEYFILRSGQTKNKFLKLRYNQIVWKGKHKKKNENQPKKIIDLSLELIHIESLDDELKHETIEILKNAFKISTSIRKYRYNDILTAFKSILATQIKDDAYTKANIITFIERNKGSFENADLHHIIYVCEIVYDQLIELNDSIWFEMLTEAAMKIADKLNLDFKIWLERRAKAYENFADFRMDDESRIVPLSFLSKALEAYRLAGNKEKAEEIGIKYSNIRKELKLNEVKFPADDKNLDLLNELLKSHVEAVTSGSSDSIYYYLGNGKDIFPSKEGIEESANRHELTFMDFASLIKFDLNSNINTNRLPTDEDKFYEQYSLNFNIYTINLLNGIFREGIKLRKLTFRTFVEYLSKNSWLSQTLDYVDNTGRISFYSWLGLIAPSILDFYYQYDSALLSNTFSPSFVLSLDSLTLKFEGILRDFVRRNGINTVTSSRGGGIREMFTEDLLSNNEVQNLFREDDIEYFKYIFTSKGVNLRNNIAHSFYTINEYSYMKVIFVIVGILRMSNYKLIKSSEQSTKHT